jgi:hypothetical protein
MNESLKRAPVEIRNEQAVLMGRATVATVEQHLGARLPKGTYTARVALPKGQYLVQTIEVTADGRLNLGDLVERLNDPVPVGPATPTIPSQDGEDKRSAGAALPAMPALEPMGAQPEPVSDVNGTTYSNGASYFSLFDGTFRNAKPIAWERAVKTGVQVSVQPDEASVHNGRSESLTLQVLRSSHRVLNIVVPPGCRVVVSRPAACCVQPRMEMLFDLDVVDDLIDLRNRGSLSEATAAAKTLTAGDVLAIAGFHPSAALAAAYIMIRSGIYDRASESIKALFDRIAIGPDLLILRAELHARAAKYGKAQCDFLAAAHMGIPMVTAGLTYLMDRLRFLSHTWTRRGTSVAASTNQIGPVLKEMEGIALRCDFGQVFTNYTGLSPTRAGDEVWPLPTTAMEIFPVETK